MRTLARFEQALGRRVSWGFPAHQLKVVPHAFEEMNAFYTREAQSLLFGYYRGANGLTFMCLSQDIVVHETTHALLDGLRSRFMDPSSADQAAFHEAFADIVALLSVFSFGDVLGALLERDAPATTHAPPGLIAIERVGMEALMRSVLLGLADEMQAEAGLARIGALRRSVEIEPAPGILDRPEFLEAHSRGEILVAAVMRAFVSAWTARLESLGRIEGRYLDLGRVAEEGATIAEVLLTMAIRALDYTPPIHLSFGDYLSALITADSEIRSSDAYDLRATLLDWFGRYGITPASETRGRPVGALGPPARPPGRALREPPDRRRRDVPARVGQPRRAALRRVHLHPGLERAAVRARVAGGRVLPARDRGRVPAVRRRPRDGARRASGSRSPPGCPTTRRSRCAAAAR